MILNEEHKLWPRPAYDESDEPHFVFILTPPYTGSTAMATYLATSPNVGILCKNGEGQELVPGIWRNWNTNHKIDLESIKSAWLHQYQKINTHGQIDIIVEKSPPNMVRIESIRTIFKNASCIVSNRDPVAFCSSRYFRSHNDRGALSLKERQAILSKIALNWIRRSTVLMEILSNHAYPRTSYEKFCEEPHHFKDAVQRASGKTTLPNSNAYLRIKDYPPSVISNRNEEQISRLSEFEVDAILKALEPHHDVTDFFGYSPRFWQRSR